MRYVVFYLDATKDASSHAENLRKLTEVVNVSKNRIVVWFRSVDEKSEVKKYCDENNLHCVRDIKFHPTKE